jgi:hypothetical protein
MNKTSQNSYISQQADLHPGAITVRKQQKFSRNSRSDSNKTIRKRKTSASSTRSHDQRRPVNVHSSNYHPARLRKAATIRQLEGEGTSAEDEEPDGPIVVENEQDLENVINEMHDMNEIGNEHEGEPDLGEGEEDEQEIEEEGSQTGYKDVEKEREVNSEDEWNKNEDEESDHYRRKKEIRSEKKMEKSGKKYHSQHRRHRHHHHSGGEQWSDEEDVTDSEDEEDDKKETEDSETEDTSDSSSESSTSSSESETKESDSGDSSDEKASHHGKEKKKRKRSNSKKDHYRKNKKKKMMSESGKRTHSVLKEQWGSVRQHDPMAHLMSDKKKEKIQKSVKGIEPFYRKLKTIEKPVLYSARHLREADARLYKDLTITKLQYDKQMELMNDIVNYDWKRARKGCLQQLDLIVDKLTTTNLERTALVKGRAVIDAMRADDTEATMRPMYEKATKRYKKESITQQREKHQRFFPKGGARPRKRAGFRRKNPKPPWAGAGGRNTQREGASFRGSATNHQRPGQPPRKEKRTSYSGNRQTQV